MRRYRFNQKWSSAGSLIGIAVMMMLGAGCRTTQFETARGNVSPPVPGTGLLEPGDELEIEFYYAPELNIMQTIREDGRVSLKLVGEVEAAGLSPSGFEEMLENRYEGLIDRPETTVTVRQNRSHVVFVGGAVTRPRAVALTPRMTILGAIIEAGDIDPLEAKINEVVVLRQAREGHYEGFAVDLARVLDGRDNDAFYLLPGDIVSVPRRRVANMNRWIEQYINRMIPFGFFASYRTGDLTYGVNTGR